VQVQITIFVKADKHLILDIYCIVQAENKHSLEAKLKHLHAPFCCLIRTQPFFSNIPTS
jgi:hypothetical protein